MELGKLFRPAATLFLIFTVLLGFVYPILITAVSQVAFNNQANGSVIYKNGVGVGSALIGQEFQSAKYFWSRPSATSGSPYSPFDSDKVDWLKWVKPWAPFQNIDHRSPGTGGSAACASAGKQRSNSGGPGYIIRIWIRSAH